MAELNVGDGTRERIDRAREPVADTLQGAADALRDRAAGLPGGEKVAGMARGAAGALDSSATYLKSRDTSQMMQDLLALVKRHPTQALLAVGALGFVIARALRRN